MSKYIKPTLSFTSNAESATTDPGPSSIALALNTTPTADTRGRIAVDGVYHRKIETSTTLNVDSNTAEAVVNMGNGPLDGSAFAGGDGDSGLTPGTVGALVYLKNNSTTTNENIYISIATAGGNQASAVPAATGAGGTALEEADHETLRTMTLKPGEFAFFPWDYTGDIHWVAATGTPELEVWMFDRG